MLTAMKYIIKTLFGVLLLAALVLFFACERDSEQTITNKNLFGNWIRPVYSFDTITYERSENLISTEYGISLHADFTLTERKNSSWCGTPPVEFSDYNGTWSQLDSIVNISADYWGGVQVYRWKLISVDNQRLKVKYLE